MSALDDLKNRIDSAIYTNTEQNITGDGLQTVLDDMVDTMGVSVSQNSETGHIDINIGTETVSAASVDDVDLLDIKTFSRRIETTETIPANVAANVDLYNGKIKTGTKIKTTVNSTISTGIYITQRNGYGEERLFWGNVTAGQEATNEYTLQSDIEQIVLWTLGTNTESGTIDIAIEINTESLEKRVEKLESDVEEINTDIEGIDEAIEVIPEIQTAMPKKETLILSAFSTHETQTSVGTSFNGWATLYNISNNSIIAVDVYAIFRSGDANVTVKCDLLSPNFSTLLGSAQMTVPSNNTTKKYTFVFDSPVSVNGDFYIKVYSDDGYVVIKNRTSDQCSATGSYQNKYRNTTTWDNIGYDAPKSYSLDVVFYSIGLLKITANPKIINIGDFYNADYNEIQDALNAITDDSPTNPYLLLVHPKGTPYAPFSMIRSSFTQAYPWGNITPRNISIIGLDKEHCLIQSDKGDYYYPAAELLTNGIIKNLRFKLSNENYTAWEKQGGYAAHIDCAPKDNVGYRMVLEDCDFESSTGPALGIGTHENCNLIIRRCNCLNTASPSYSPVEEYTNIANWGAIFMHTSTDSSAQNQNFTLEDCVARSILGSKSLGISVYSTNCIATLLRNIMWADSQNAPSVNLGSGITYNPMNFGNNFS